MSRRTDIDIPGPLQDLVERIHRQHRNDKQLERRPRSKRTLLCLLLCAVCVFSIQLRTQIYNAIGGPFHLNQTQLAKHLQIYNQGLSPSSLLRWFSLHEEYLQIEIGEDRVERMQSKVPRVFDDEYTRKTTLASIHRIKDLRIARSLSPDRFFIRLADETQSHTRARLPYHFDAFTIRTLRCAVRQLGVRPSDYITWVEKSIYVQTIERRYAENAAHFNRLVAPACGMLIGYLYRPQGELAYLPYSTSAYVFRSEDIGFDASQAYYPYAAFAVIGILLGGFLLKSGVYLIIHRGQWPSRRRVVLSPDVQAQLDELNLHSLRKLDGLLSATSDKRQYHQRLFVIRERFLIILHVDWNESDPQRLRQFYTASPFTVYSVASITKVSENGFRIGSRGEETWISFPVAMRATDDNESEWLHEQMMSLSKSYRQSRKEDTRWAEAEVRRREQEALQRESFIREEERLQRVNFERTREAVAAAPPRYIANFRLKALRHVQAKHTELLTSECSICLTKFELGECFARWPCRGLHPFHQLCMLNTLRVTDKCPLCRHDVLATPTLDGYALFELMFPQFLNRRLSAHGQFLQRE